MTDSYCAKTREDLRNLSFSQFDKLLVLSDLSDNELKKSASNWSAKYLIAYRLLLTGPENNILDTFRREHEHCPACQKPSYQKLDPDMLEQLKGDFRPGEMSGTERELLQRSGGFFWLSLAQACAVEQEQDIQSRDHPQRQRQEPMRPEFVNSSSFTIEDSFMSGQSGSSGSQDGSSGSQDGSSGSEFDRSMEQTDEDTNESRRIIDEDVSVELATDFVRYVLQMCLIQPNDNFEVRVRMRRERSKANVANVIGITCIDDRGIALCEKKGDNWTTINPFMASFEVKRALRNIKEGAGDRTSPRVTDNILAQYLGEAVLTWRANPKVLTKG
ncbi:hypothetical protein E4U54_003170, partial [Claviceps lovelessii]